MLRTCLLATVLLLGLGTAPAQATEVAVPNVHFTVAPLAMSWEWNWDDFKKFWSKQLGKTTGVLGSVSLVVFIGVLIVMSAKKKT